MQQMCRQLSDTTAAADRLNSAVGGRCQGLKGRCNVACVDAVQQLQPMVSQCNGNGCDQAAVNKDFDALQGGARACNNLNPDTVLSQAREQTNANNIAEQCRQLSAQNPGAAGVGSSTPGGSTPSDRSAAGNGRGSDSGSGQRENSGNQTRSQSAGGGMNMGQMLPLAMMAMQMMNQQNQQQPQQQTPTNPSLDKVDCTVNPNLAGCPTGTPGSDSWNPKTASIDGAANNATGGSFNPADEKSMTPTSNDPAGEPKQATPVTVGSVPNGGGGMPGGGGGGSASLGGGGGGGGGGVSAKTVTDIMHGMGGGGGGMSAMAANMNMKNGEGGGGYTYGQGGYGQHDETGLDLSQFLPGGKQDPTRKVAGIAAGGPGNFQIQSKEVNIWSRISERFKARCSQGLLRDCIP